MPIHWSPVILIPAAYLAGSVNFSILLFKILGKEDPRQGFSGNPGTTNVYRQAGLTWAMMVLTLDVGRSVAIAIGGIHLLTDTYITWLGFGLILGNRFPCFHGFRGGKGVANFLGFSTALSPWAGLIAALTWVAVNAGTKTPFIASFAMVTVLSIGTTLMFADNISANTATILTALLIVASHKKNMAAYFSNLKKKGSS